MCIIISLEWNIQLTVHRYPAKYIQIVVCRLKLMICCFTNLFILKTSFLLPFMTCLNLHRCSDLSQNLTKKIPVVKTSSLYNIPTQTSFLFAIKSPTLILLSYSTDCSFLQGSALTIFVHQSQFYFTAQHNRQKTRALESRRYLFLFFLVAEDKQVSDHSNQ